MRKVKYIQNYENNLMWLDELRKVKAEYLAKLYGQRILKLNQITIGIRKAHDCI